MVKEDSKTHWTSQILKTNSFVIIFPLPGIFSNIEKVFRIKLDSKYLVSFQLLSIVWFYSGGGGTCQQVWVSQTIPLKMKKKKPTTKPAPSESWYPACIFIGSIQEWNPLQALLFTPPCICDLVTGTWRNQRLWYLFTHMCQWWGLNFEWTTTIPRSQILSAHLWKQGWKENSALASTRHFSNWVSCELALDLGALAIPSPHTHIFLWA